MGERDTATVGAGKLTYADYVALPDDGRRYEILDGKLVVTPAPTIRHQLVSKNLVLVLDVHVRAHDLGTVLYAPVDVILDEKTVVEPDILFVSKVRGNIISERALEGPPDLVIEILSPSTEARDRGAKLELYARHGVAWYWITDIDARTVDIFELADGAYRRVHTSVGDETLVAAPFEGLTIELREIWA